MASSYANHKQQSRNPANQFQHQRHSWTASIFRSDPRLRTQDLDSGNSAAASAATRHVDATSRILARAFGIASSIAKGSGQVKENKSLPGVFATNTAPRKVVVGLEKTGRVATSTPLPDPFRQNPGTQPQSRRFNQIGPLATPVQKLRANLELWKNEHPVSSAIHALASEMVADIDMENMPPGHDFRAFGGADNLDLMSMDEFEKANPYTPPPPRRTANPLRASTKHGEFTTAFNLACDARGIARDFAYFEVAIQCFEVELKLNGKLVDRIGPYASHKDGKEEMCKKHLPTVEAMPNQKKRKVSDVAFTPVPAGLEDEPWINLIYQYLQKNQLPFPDFELKSQNEQNENVGPWTCTLRIKGSPHTPFGGDDKRYANKMNAKKAAAMEAVQWLRSQTKMAAAPEKRRKSSVSVLESPDPANSSSQSEDPGHTGLTQTLRSADVNANLAKPSEQVHQLALDLGFCQPAYRHVPVPMSESFYNTHAEFLPGDVRKEPRLAGHVGQTSHVFGKKHAQQACATEVLKVLEDIRRSRLMR
ncbi:hypothetical protein CB0940_11991 [Cercospora beticola]|uniref:DRBM domain-containing protein n=1 Tax=Cercospora beticola TaxID=122368 RepID=A0A2G5IE90_CERBT|nr:hypothetical protein CB0940_11991 [Cercospora beticola]PIB02972.1 hypothetical protein CB0940_11991 [Cercospora beticola]WPB04372.1 hypothetical protein RHO25_009018 [Cercospora beticola]CAK1356803.1 unnamed protein product [Cercospora beticola]